MSSASPAKSWLRALELTAPITRNPSRLLSTVIEEFAAHLGEEPALLSDGECLTYRGLSGRANRYARWALDQGIAKGEVVGLLMPNRPEYLAIWLGITSAGAVVALLNTNLTGASLAHCINIVAPKHVIVAAEFVDRLTAVLPNLAVAPTTWCHGKTPASFPRVDLDIARREDEKLGKAERRPTTIEDRALYIYTSGTTGLPKAANVSHARIMQWSHWFSGMMAAQPADRMFSCLPMYHSVGGVLAPGAMLVAGGSLVIREKLSASRFWSDVTRWDCTLIQYIGELCRYLLHTAPSSKETEHRVRMACGNGLAPDVWDDFKKRFRIPRIFEFYAATEGGVSLFNIEGERGAIGRVPPYLAHRFSPAIVQFDAETGEPVREERGFCIRCRSHEIGEAIGQVQDNEAHTGSRFEGYTSEEDSEKRILRNVFEPGDRWVRTGDLMRSDDRGFFYFVDRAGDTFRWKGENVAASEVAQAILEFPGIRHASVYGVALPFTEGRAGMAALVTDEALDLAAFRQHLVERLPHYACPLFVRLLNEVEATGTFKYSKVDLIRQGYDPVASADVIYFNDPQSKAFVRLDKSLYEGLQTGQVRI